MLSVVILPDLMNVFVRIISEEIHILNALLKVSIIKNILLLKFKLIQIVWISGKEQITCSDGHPCPLNEECINTSRSNQCVCRRGYIRDAVGEQCRGNADIQTIMTYSK
jgi:hypothetical protein